MPGPAPTLDEGLQFLATYCTERVRTLPDYLGPPLSCVALACFSARCGHDQLAIGARAFFKWFKAS